MDRTSAFTLGYIPAYPKLENTGLGKRAFLAVSNDSASTLTRMGFSSNLSSDIAANGFWYLAVQSVNETHTDAFVINDALSDTISFFAMGAVPIGISISGVVITSPDKDDRLNFLKLYSDKLRGIALAEARAILFFGYKDTVMRLYIQSITITDDVNAEGITQISIMGYASHYGVTSFTYDGMSTPVSESTTPSEATTSSADYGISRINPGDWLV